jgi:hypothetical protein
MNIRNILPDVSELLECFHFDFETGIVTRIKDYKGRSVKKTVGCKSDQGYLTVVYKGKTYLLHRLIWKAYYHTEPPFILDHIDENKLNNSIQNLRECSRATNKVRSSKMVNSSGYRGVFKRYDRASWEVRVSFRKTHREYLGRKDVSVGYYKNIEEAAAAYNLALDSLSYTDYHKNITDYPSDKVNINKKFFKTNWRELLSLEST